MAARPLVTVYDSSSKATDQQIKLPAVFRCPIRPDIVSHIHQQMSKNSRQARAVSTEAGKQTSAESWGTGRAVARIPRVRGGGTHRSGQAAYGNMCRGGHMFAPLKVWRRWHRKVPLRQKRYAVASAIAASGVPALVMARGHVIDRVPEIPFVVSDAVEGFRKTKEAVKFLRDAHLFSDIAKVIDSKRKRAGKGKGRNRKYRQKKGPLVIYGQDRLVERAFRNIPGVSLLHVEKLNLLKLAPGGHLGRLVIWTESAFKKLDAIYGSEHTGAPLKKGFTLPTAKMANPDFSRIIRSEEVTKAVRPHKKNLLVKKVHGNPLKNVNLMVKLNPYIEAYKKSEQEFHKKAAAKKTKA